MSKLAFTWSDAALIVIAAILFWAKLSGWG